MNTEKKVELLNEQLSDVAKLKYNDGFLNKSLKTADMKIKKIFGENSDYRAILEKLRFSPRYITNFTEEGSYVRSFSSGKRKFLDLVQVMLEDVELTESIEGSSTIQNENVISDNIFIVHGHNNEMKESTARFIEKIGLKAIILHEQASNGRTIIEKFTDHSNVSFAIVLLSADDLAFKRDDKPENSMFRARQNVILELGFFLGKIGRERVVVLHEKVSNLEIPSDYSGVIYVPFDDYGNWRLSVMKELNAVGFNVDANKLLEL
jgi:predicted nucleotide-binding protein